MFNGTESDAGKGYILTFSFSLALCSIYIQYVTFHMPVQHCNMFGYTLCIDTVADIREIAGYIKAVPFIKNNISIVANRISFNKFVTNAAL